MNTNAFKAIENELKRQKQYNCIDLSHLGIHIHNSSNIAFKLTWCQYTGALGSPRELRFAFKEQTCRLRLHRGTTTQHCMKYCQQMNANRLQLQSKNF